MLLLTMRLRLRAYEPCSWPHYYLFRQVLKDFLLQDAQILNKLYVHQHHLSGEGVEVSVTHAAGAGAPQRRLGPRCTVDAAAWRGAWVDNLSTQPPLRD